MNCIDSARRSSALTVCPRPPHQGNCCRSRTFAAGCLLVNPTPATSPSAGIGPPALSTSPPKSTGPSNRTSLQTIPPQFPSLLQHRPARIRWHVSKIPQWRESCTGSDHPANGHHSEQCASRHDKIALYARTRSNYTQPGCYGRQTLRARHACDRRHDRRTGRDSLYTCPEIFLILNLRS